MEKILKQVYDYIDSQKEAIVETLREVVNIESYGYSKEDVNKVAIKFKELFEAEGLCCKLIPAEPNGYCLSGILGKDRPGKPCYICRSYGYSIRNRNSSKKTI